MSEQHGSIELQGALFPLAQINDAPKPVAQWEWDRGARGLLVAGKSVQPFPNGFENKC